MKKKLFAVLFTLLCVFSFSSCSNDDGDESGFYFANRCWQEIEDGSTEEDYYMYYKDGVLYDCTFVSAYGWYMVDEYEQSITSPKSIEGVTISISGNYMTVTIDSTGEKLTYKEIELPEGFAAKIK